MDLAPRTSLALVLHNHQPVGNFGWVIEDVYRTAYEPLVAALERHPQVRLGLHYTGPLLDWLATERPAFLDRLRALVAADRIELLGGGYYEPVLASLPEADRLTQLRLMADAVERIGGRRPVRRLAGRTGLGAGPAGGPRGRWLSLDDPRRRPLPRRRHRRFTPLGPLHDRRPGPHPRPVRIRQAAPLSDPVRRRGRRHRLPPRSIAGRRPQSRGDGRRRREVRLVAGDLPALLGRRRQERLGGPLLRRARGEPRLAGARDTERMAGSRSPARPGLRAHIVVRGDGRVGPAGGRGPRLRTRPSTTQRRLDDPRRAGCAVVSGATSR